MIGLMRWISLLFCLGLPGLVVWLAIAPAFADGVEPEAHHHAPAPAAAAAGTPEPKAAPEAKPETRSKADAKAAAAPQPVAATPPATGAKGPVALGPEGLGAIMAAANVAFTQAESAEGTIVFALGADTLLADGMDVRLTGCDGAGRCRDAALRAWFRTPHGATLESVNAWNQARRFSRAYLDAEGDAVLEADIVAGAGLDAEGLAAQIQTWFRQINAFAESAGRS